MVLEVFTHQFRIRFRYAKILKLTKIILNFLSTAKRTKKNEQKNIISFYLYHFHIKFRSLFKMYHSNIPTQKDFFHTYLNNFFMLFWTQKYDFFFSNVRISVLTSIARADRVHWRLYAYCLMRFLFPSR